MAWQVPVSLYLFVAALPSIVGFCLHLVFAKVFRLRIQQIALGSIQSGVKFRVFDTEIAIGYLPVNICTTFLDESNRDLFPTVEGNWNELRELPLWKHLLVVASPLLAMLVIALATLGPADFIRHARSAVPQLFGGAIHPDTVGQELLNKYAAVLDQSLLRAWGIVTSKLLVWYSIPFLGSHGFLIMYLVAVRLFGISGEGSFNLLIGAMLMSPFLIPAFGWLIALAKYVGMR